MPLRQSTGVYASKLETCTIFLRPEFDQRSLSPPTRLVERALGTVLGVVFASLLLWTPLQLLLTIPIAVLAAVVIGGTLGIGLAAGRQNRAYLDGANSIYCRLAPARPSFCSPLRAHAHGSE